MAGSSTQAFKIKPGDQLRYPDLKYLFIRGLLKHEHWQRRHHYLKSAAECTSRAIVSLDLCQTSIKSVRQAQQIPGIGEEISRVLRRLVNDTEISRDVPKRGTCISSASAILVALLSLTEESSECEDSVIPEDVLRERVKEICEETVLDQSSPGFCQAWWRLQVLITRGLVKRRSLKKKAVYQLLLPGETLAREIRHSSSDLSDKTSNHAASSSVRDVLYTNDNHNQAHGLILLVDQREWGGDAVGLGQLCKMFEDVGIKYRTEILDCGDYQWRWRCDEEEIILPVAVERKRADDLAAGLKDGRFWKQINNMLNWQERVKKQTLGGSLHYIIEGDLEKYVVQCEDGCQGVGRCGHPPLPAVQAAVRDLETHPSLCVHKTNSLLNTINLLAVFSADIGKRIFDGEFDNLRTTSVPDTNGNTVERAHSGQYGHSDIKPGTLCKSHDTESTTMCNTGNGDDDDDDVILVSCEIPDIKPAHHSSQGCSNYYNINSLLSRSPEENGAICRESQELSVSTEVQMYDDDIISQSSMKRKLEDSWNISSSKGTTGGKVYLMKKGHKQRTSCAQSTSSRMKLNLTRDTASPHNEDGFKGDNSLPATDWSALLASDSLPDLTL